MSHIDAEVRGWFAMSNECPHCGCELPLVRDAFCPECFGELDPGPQPRIQVKPRVSEEAGGAVNPARLGLFILGAVLIVFGVFIRYFFPQRSVAETIYMAGSGFVLLLAALFWPGKRPA